MSNTSRISAALTSALVATGVIASFWAVEGRVASHDWRLDSGMVITVVAAVVIGSRAVRMPSLLVPVVGLGAAVVAMIPSFVRTAEGSRAFLPSVDNLGAWVVLVRDGAQLFVTTPGPAPVETSVVATLTTFFVCVYVIADYLATTMRWPGAAGVALLLPWALPALTLADIHVGGLIATVALWLAVIASTPTEKNPIPVATRISASTGVIAVSVICALTLTPLIIGAPGWGFAFERWGPQNTPTSTALDEDVDLRESLTTLSDIPSFAYVTTGEQPGAFRLHTYAFFDGSQWSRAPASERIPLQETSPAWPETVAAWPQESLVDLSIASVTLEESSLPLPVGPRFVSVTPDWAYSPDTDQVLSDSSTTRDLQYRAVFDPTFPSESILRASEQSVDTTAESVPSYYTSIPAGTDVSRLSTLTEDITSGVDGRLESALAIQDYLRDPAHFTYDPTVAPATGDAIGSFLDSRTGYCVQFASTMVMMLRTQDIPARLAVGFLPGERETGDTFVVRGRDAHAWPEVYFPGVGWIRFEPTPAEQSGPAPDFASIPAVEPSPTPSASPSTAPVFSPAPTASTRIPSPSPSAIDTPHSAGFLPLWGAVALIAVALCGIALWGVLRARKTSRAPSVSGAETAWASVRQALGHDAWPASATPAEAAALTYRQLTDLGSDEREAPHAWSAVEKLAHEVSRQRYAPEGASVSDEECTEWAEGIRRALTRKTQRP